MPSQAALARPAMLKPFELRGAISGADAVRIPLLVTILTQRPNRQRRAWQRRTWLKHLWQCTLAGASGRVPWRYVYLRAREPDANNELKASRTGSKSRWAQHVSSCQGRHATLPVGVERCTGCVQA